MLTGDQVPPPYPILDVHVPERPLLMFALVPAAVLLPSVFFCIAAQTGSLEKKWAAAESRRGQLQLEELQHRLASADDVVWTSMAALATKIDHAAALAENAVGQQHTHGMRQFTECVGSLMLVGEVSP